MANNFYDDNQFMFIKRARKDRTIRIPYDVLNCIEYDYNLESLRKEDYLSVQIIQDMLELDELRRTGSWKRNLQETPGGMTFSHDCTNRKLLFDLSIEPRRAYFRIQLLVGDPFLGLNSIDVLGDRSIRVDIQMMTGSLRYPDQLSCTITNNIRNYRLVFDNGSAKYLIHRNGIQETYERVFGGLLKDFVDYLLETRKIQSYTKLGLATHCSCVGHRSYNVRRSFIHSSYENDRHVLSSLIQSLLIDGYYGLYMSENPIISISTQEE